MKLTAITLFLLAGGTAYASSTLFTLTPYNAFIFGTFTGTGSDYGGGVAAGGSLTIGGTSVAGALLGEQITDLPGQYSLVAGATLTATNGTLYAGNAYGGGPNNNFSLTPNGGGHFSSPPTADPINFASQQSNFQNLSSSLAGLSSTGNCTYDGYSTTTCTASNSGLNVINLSDPSLLGPNHTVNITLAANAYLVINVAGTADTLTGWSININGSGANGDSTTSLAHNVLFNYYQATSLNFTSVVGSVLAPYASVTGSSGGQIDGSLVANSFYGPTEFHNFGFEGTLPSVTITSTTPEPAAYLLIGTGLIGLAMIRRRAGK